MPGTGSGQFFYERFNFYSDNLNSVTQFLQKPRPLFTLTPTVSDMRIDMHEQDICLF